MIGFQDFAPVVSDQGGFLRMPVVEQLSEPMKRANDWIKNQSVDVLNVETVVSTRDGSRQGKSFVFR